MLRGFFVKIIYLLFTGLLISVFSGSYSRFGPVAVSTGKISQNTYNYVKERIFDNTALPFSTTSPAYRPFKHAVSDEEGNRDKAFPNLEKIFLTSETNFGNVHIMSDILAMFTELQALSTFQRSTRTIRVDFLKGLQSEAAEGEGPPTLRSDEDHHIFYGHIIYSLDRIEFVRKHLKALEDVYEIGSVSGGGEDMPGYSLFYYNSYKQLGLRKLEYLESVAAGANIRLNRAKEEAGGCVLMCSTEREALDALGKKLAGEKALERTVEEMVEQQTQRAKNETEKDLEIGA